MTESMNLQHVIVKIPVEGELAIEPGELINVFHRWVAEQSMPELLIDVADLRHVPSGPGVVLVGSQADYSLDHSHDRWGLQYRRKDVLEGSNVDRLTQAFTAARHACERLEQELGGRVRFSRRAPTSSSTIGRSHRTPTTHARRRSPTSSSSRNWLSLRALRPSRRTAAIRGGGSESASRRNVSGRAHAPGEVARPYGVELMSWQCQCPVVTPHGERPTRIFFSIVSVVRSMTVTSPEPPFAV